MGRGILKRKNTMKKLYLNQAVKEIERLEKENQALKGDPNTMIGQFIGQFRELYGQNSRLSVLSACLIKKLEGLGSKVVFTKEEMDAFKGNRINIKWELPEGVENAEDANEFVFGYELVPEPTAQAQQVQATETPMPQCTDPECTLPKDLAHVHTPTPAAGETVYVPDVPNSDEPQSGLVTIVPDAEVEVTPGATTDGTALVAPDFGPGEQVEDTGDVLSTAVSSD